MFKILEVWHLSLSHIMQDNSLTLLNLNLCSVILLITEPSKCKIDSLPIYTHRKSYSHPGLNPWTVTGFKCHCEKVTLLHYEWYLHVL